MKLFKYCLLFVFLFVITTNAGVVFVDIEAFQDGIRNQLKITSTTMLPESIVIEISKRALLWTSTDIGGYEQLIRFATVADKPFYPVPDSITEILFATLISTNNKITKSIKAWHPEYFEDAFDLQELTGEGDDQTPKAYNYFSDTIQIIPTPSKADSIFLKCYMEHPMPVTADSTIHLRPAFAEAALMYACSEVQAYLGRYNESDFYMARYDKLKGDLMRKYKAKFGLAFGANK